MDTQQEQKEEAYLIWYSFGIRAKELLTDVSKLQLDDINILDFECLQLACETSLNKLKEDLKNHINKYQD